MEQDKVKATPTKILIIRMAIRLLFLVLLTVFAFTLLGDLVSLFLPFIVSYALTAFFIAPIIGKLPKKAGGTRRFLSILIIVLLTLAIAAIAGVAVYFVVTQIIDLITNWEAIRDTLVESLGKLSDFISKIVDKESTVISGGILKYVEESLTSLKDSLGSYVPDVIVTIGNTVPSIGSFLLGALFALLGTYFVAADYPNISSKFTASVPELIKPHVKLIGNAAGSAMFGYLRAQIIISGIIALVAFIVLLCAGQKFSILLGLCIGIVDFVPLLGSGLVTVPWAALTILQGNYRLTVILLVLTFVLFMFRKIVEPKIVGDQTGLHPLVSLICIYIGMVRWGVLGMILTPVVVMAFVSLYRMGFFTPTINDIKELTARTVSYLKSGDKE